LIDLKRDRVDYWIGKGAQPSDTVRSFLRSNRKPV
jgi:ribosomal protein S16